MNTNAEILACLIEEDFGIKGSQSSKWARSLDHDSLIIDKERGLFFWNSRNIVGDPLVYLMEVRKLDFHDAKEHLKNFRYSGTLVYTINSEYTKKDVVVYPPLVDVFYEDGRSKRQYFYDRGLTDETIDMFKLGFYNNFNTIPVYMDGTFRNFQLRKDNPKTIRPYYRGTGALLFNSDIIRLTKTLYYVEGPVDAMIMVQNGFPTVSGTAGGTFKNEWFSKFVNVEKIYLLFDNDKAGVDEAKRLGKVLGFGRCKMYTFSDFGDKGYDPVDFFRDGTAAELDDIIINKSKYIFEV